MKTDQPTATHVGPLQGKAPVKPRADGRLEGGLVIGAAGRSRKTPVGFVHPSATSNFEPGAPALVQYDGDSHLLTFGYTGSGKTSGPVIMNALSYPGSAVFIDPKGDVYEATAEQRRRMGHEVVLLDMRWPNPESGSFNPVDAFRRAGGDSNLIARTAAAVLVEFDDKEQAFWRNWAVWLCTGGLAYALDHCPPHEQTFGRLYDMFNNDDVVYGFAALLDKHAGQLHRGTHAAFSGLLQLPDRETRPSVLGSTQQHLMLWESDFVRDLTGHTSFDLDGFIEGKPISIYIVPSPTRMAAYAPLLRLWLAGLMAALTTRRKPPEYRTLMMCDEAGALGKLDAFVTASCLLRSSGVQLWTFWQNPSQLEIYGAGAKTLIDNAGVVQLLGARNQRMASDFAALVGGISGEQIMEMGRDEQVVLIDGGLPRVLRRARYFDRPEFSGLVGTRRS